MGQARRPGGMRQIFVSFAMRTSLRGIPQIVRAKGWLRIMWLVCVSGLFIGCLVNLHEIVRQYLQFDTIQQPKSRLDQSATFPSFTLCNQNPLSRRGREVIRERGWPTPRQYWRALLRLISATSNGTMDPYKNSLLNHLHYWYNLPDKDFNYTELGHSINQLVTKCFAVVLKPNEEPPVGHILCHEIGEWRRIDHPDHLNCYMYNIRPEYASKVIYTEMQVFLDYSANESYCIDCLMVDVNTLAWGARLVLHEQGSYPDISKDGFNVMPGTFTEVKIVPNAWHRLEPPWGQCSGEVPARLRVASGEEFAYSSRLCDSLSKQATIVAKCGCYTATLPEPPGLASRDLRPCEAFGSVANITADQLNRAAKASRCYNGIAHNSTGQCGEPCFHYTYETIVSQAGWPRHSFHLDFAGMLSHSERGRGGHYKEIVQHYANIKKALKRGEPGAAAALHEDSLISRSFLTVKIAKKDHMVKVFEEKAVRTLPSTLSQVGGLFSMWIGVTLIWIVEIMDLLIQIVRYLCRGDAGSGGGGGGSGGGGAEEAEPDGSRERNDAEQPLRARKRSGGCRSAGSADGGCVMVVTTC